jgi:23S rRNA U2552 (ribose-2'-O)-methylase RlmE/FtsJ
MNIALEVLSKRGHFVTKLFQSELTQELVALAKDFFDFVRLFKPSASPSRSPEIYLIAKYYRKPTK